MNLTGTFFWQKLIRPARRYLDPGRDTERMANLCEIYAFHRSSGGRALKVAEHVEVPDAEG